MTFKLATDFSGWGSRDRASGARRKRRVRESRDNAFSHRIQDQLAKAMQI